uniref:Transmembrane protein n=1 Tax=Cannabis sativa TaxID=3483 RepID=A0A803P9E7_CANSA
MVMKVFMAKYLKDYNILFTRLMMMSFVIMVGDFVSILSRLFTDDGGGGARSSLFADDGGARFFPFADDDGRDGVSSPFPIVADGRDVPSFPIVVDDRDGSSFSQSSTTAVLGLLLCSSTWWMNLLVGFRSFV